MDVDFHGRMHKIGKELAWRLLYDLRVCIYGAFEHHELFQSLHDTMVYIDLWEGVYN